MDIGCGSGRVLLDIMEPAIPKHYHKIVGTDISDEMIDYCKQLKTDSRVYFERMNIEAETIPKEFLHSFDYLFSCFVFHYMTNLRQAWKNCSQLLKPGGELGFIFMYTEHPLYETYRRMHCIEEWKFYTEKFKNYTPPFKSKDPLLEMEMIMKEQGIDVLWSGLNHDTYRSEAENFVALFSSVDSIYLTIPEDKKTKYKKDFAETLGQVMGFSTKEADLKKIVEVFFPAIVVHAKKHQ